MFRNIDSLTAVDGNVMQQLVRTGLLNVNWVLRGAASSKKH
jgi:hypothetical protein